MKGAPCDLTALARTSSVHTPTTGTFKAKPMIRAVTIPTRSPVYGPGPTPTATLVRSPRADRGVCEHTSDPWGQQLAVAKRVDHRRLCDDVFPVVEGDSDRGARGVEGEKHEDPA